MRIERRLKIEDIIMPRAIEEAIAKHTDAAWAVLHTSNDSHQYVDIFSANGKAIFQLTWWSRLSKPNWKLL